jgi:hypothetical protein
MLFILLSGFLHPAMILIFHIYLSSSPYVFKLTEVRISLTLNQIYIFKTFYVTINIRAPLNYSSLLISEDYSNECDRY